MSNERRFSVRENSRREKALRLGTQGLGSQENLCSELPNKDEIQRLNLNSEVGWPISIFLNSDIGPVYLLSTSAKLRFAMVTY
jgi:hypothetical protein